MTSITDKDSKAVSFSYNEGIELDENHENGEYLQGFNFLTSAIDVDGYKIRYTYTMGNLPKVLRIEEMDIPVDSTVYEIGSTLTFSYGYNQTKITDHGNNYQLLQFNDWGNLVSVQDSLGRAQLAQYAFTDYDDTSSDTTAKANQLREASKMLSTVTNLLPNSSFEGGGIWSGGSAASIGYIGTESMQVNASSSATYNSTGFTVERGQTITFSAYVKTSSTNKVKLTLVSGSNTLATGEEITSSSEFTRIQLSYTNTGSTSVTVVPQIVNGSGGVAYVDCVQLEYMPTASRYNLVKNGMITSLASWTRYNCTGNDGYINISSLNDESGQPRKTAMPILGEGVYRIVGNPLSKKYIAQTINISGVEGDAYILSGWAMADAVPLSGGREFGLKLVFKKEGSVVGEFYEEFNTAISGRDWQFTACYANAPAAYDSITVEVLYNYAANTAYFDGIQLLKERFGSTYTYEDGNVKTAMDEEGNVTQYTYADNDLTTVVQPDGKTTTYTYDIYHNVKTVTTPEGVFYTYVYDYEDPAIDQPFGNVISTSIGSGTTKITSTATYSDNGNILVSTKDALDKVTTYGYNVNTNVLEWVQYPNDTESTRTEYTYDSMFRLDVAAKDVNSESALSADYEYTDDFLTEIQTKSTTYSFTYGAFGLRESIKVGSRTLATYTYTAQDHDVSVLSYGNGDSVTYTYDDYGRVILEAYEDGSTIAYAYDNDGALATVTDSESGIKTTYYYDFSSRLMKYVESGSSYSHSIGYEFDNTTNNISKLVETINGVQYTTTYTYDGDNRVQTLNTSINSTSGCTVGYTYDSYGRTNTITTQLGSATTFARYYFYHSAGSGKTSNQVYSYRTLLGTQNIIFYYTYDNNGNILTVREGSSLAISYEYDSANQLIRENNAYAQKTWVWTYDDAGNILSRTEYEYTTGDLATINPQAEYKYTDTSWGDLLTEYGGKTISYDGIGNPVSDGTWSYTWKQGRQLATMSNGSTTWTYTYDANGMRTKRSNGSLTYSYVYNGSQLSQLTVAGATLKFIYDASGTPVAVVFNGVPYYYVTNLQGDIEGIVNVSGQVMVAYVYDAWGKLIDTSGSMETTLGKWNPLRYRGYVYDEESGLYYLQSRYYNPTWGRFINADALVSTGQGILGNNMFAYCGNNPINGYDPCGMCPHTLQSRINSQLSFAQSCNCGSTTSIGGGISILYPIIWIEEIIGNTTHIFENWLDEQKKVVVDTLSKSLARSKNRRSDDSVHTHHIVPRNDLRGLPAFIVIQEVFPDLGVEDPRNLVQVSSRIHSRLHTNAYYLLVNNVITLAYLSAGDNVVLQEANITAALSYLSIFITSLEGL